MQNIKLSKAVQFSNAGMHNGLNSYNLMWGAKLKKTPVCVPPVLQSSDGTPENPLPAPSGITIGVKECDRQGFLPGQSGAPAPL